MPIPGGRGKENPMTDMMLTWKQGVYAFDRKDYGSAVEHFSEVLASEPGKPELPRVPRPGAVPPGVARSRRR